MTYCLAWKSKEGVFITADSAITTEGIFDSSNSKSKTSLGEQTIVEEKYRVEDSANKIIRIDNSLLMCYSGDLSIFFEVLGNIKKYFNKDNPLKSVEMGTDSVRTNSTLELKIIFAIRSNERISLHSWNLNNDCRILEHSENEIVHIGSLKNTEFPNYFVERFNSYIINLNANSFIKHLYLHYLIQSLSIYEYTIQVGVGGLYNSGFLTTSGIHFIDDSSIILYKPLNGEFRIETIGICNYFNRPDAFIYNSTISGTKEIFLNDNLSLLTDTVSTTEIEEYSLNYDPKIIVFYSVSTKLISLFIVDRIKNDYFKLEFNDGKVTFGITAKGLELLLIQNPTSELEYNVIIDVK